MKKFILWAPRVLAALFILFISLFALDSFGTGKPFWEEILGFLIHLVPTYVLIGFLLAGWQLPLVGGLLFIAGGIFYLVMARGQHWAAYLFISGPAFLTGTLFLLQKFLPGKAAAEKQTS